MGGAPARRIGQSRFASPALGLRNEKGHGNSIRRSAMTSILKRDDVWSRPPGRSLRLVSTMRDRPFNRFSRLKDRSRGSERKDQANLRSRERQQKKQTRASPLGLARAAFLTATFLTPQEDATRQFQAFATNFEVKAPIGAQVELSVPGAGAGESISSGIGASLGVTWGAAAGAS
jgi:hypothetical protein